MNIITGASVTAAVVTVLGFGAKGLKGAAKQSTIDALQVEIASVRGQLGDALSEKSLLENRVENAEKNEQIFKDIALGKPDFNKLSIQLTTQHKEILTSFKNLTEGISSLATTIAKDRRNG